jgi:hypothetical protein
VDKFIEQRAGKTRVYRDIQQVIDELLEDAQQEGEN